MKTLRQSANDETIEKINEIMEFKGTKGKSEICKTHQTITDCKGFGIAQENGIRNSNEWKANALLISKAPEMLEMLQKCQEYFLLKTDKYSDERADAIGQLIEEATEIKNK